MFIRNEINHSIMTIKLSCTNCKYKWKAVSEEKIPRRCPYCDKETVNWEAGEARFRDINEMLK